MAKQNRKFVAVEEKEKDSKKIGVDSKGRLVEVEAIPKEGAKSRRIIAILLWLVGIFFEVIAILRLKGVINWIPNLSEVAFLIICLVLDCIAVVVGSLFWKKANHIDPASEKNKLKFWIQNNFGTIVSVIAFLPIIILVLTDKDMDKKNKTIVSVVAVVLMVVAGITSYDFNPISVEQLENAEKEVLATKNFDTDKNGNAVVYWATHSKKYHVDSNCPALKNSETVFQGTVKAAYQKGLTEPCRRCIPALEEDHDHTEDEE